MVDYLNLAVELYDTRPNFRGELKPDKDAGWKRTWDENIAFYTFQSVVRQSWHGRRNTNNDEGYDVLLEYRGKLRLGDLTTSSGLTQLSQARTSTILEQLTKFNNNGRSDPAIFPRLMIFCTDAGQYSDTNDHGWRYQGERMRCVSAQQIG